MGEDKWNPTEKRIKRIKRKDERQRIGQREQTCAYLGLLKKKILNPSSSAGKKSTHNARDPSSIPGSGRSPGEGIGYPLQCSWASLVAQLVKNPPAMRETWVWCLGWEDPLEKGTDTTPIFWPGEVHGLYSPRGHKESDTTEWLSLSPKYLKI